MGTQPRLESLLEEEDIFISQTLGKKLMTSIMDLKIQTQNKQRERYGVVSCVARGCNLSNWVAEISGCCKGQTALRWETAISWHSQ